MSDTDTFRWFRLPETGDGTLDDPYRPKTFGYDVSTTGTKKHPEGAPHWIVKVYGDEADLDALADEPKAVDLGDTPTGTLNKMKGRDWPGDEWEDRFRIG